MKQICATESKSTVFHNLWELQQFEAEAGQQLQSEVFYGYSSHGQDCELSWHYVLDVKESEQIYHRRTDRYVTVHSVTLAAVIDSCSASLKVTVELEQNGSQRDSNYKISGKTKVGAKIGLITVNRDNFLQNFLTDDTVTFRLKFTLIEDPIPQDSQLLENYSSLLSNEQLSDVTILVGPAKFYAQRAILSVRSPVFAAMFQSEMQEAKLNRIVIEDIAPEVFEQVLRFIYVDRVEGLDRMAHELLAAADKYALDRLRGMCERQLLGHITQETVLKTLALADLYHARELKEEAVRFVCQNIKSMRETDWKSFANCHPDLVAEILSAMAVD